MNSLPIQIAEGILLAFGIIVFGLAALALIFWKTIRKFDEWLSGQKSN